MERKQVEKIGREAAEAVMQCEGMCVDAGIKLLKASQALKAAESSPILFAENIARLVPQEAMKVPHSELAIHIGAAGKDLVAWVLSPNYAHIVYDDDGKCGYTHGLAKEVLSFDVIRQTRDIWGSHWQGKTTRDDVKVGVWEERDRLHIYIEDKNTGVNIAEWWDDDARQMFEDGFFKPGIEHRQLDQVPSAEMADSVLSYAEAVGLLRKE